MASESPARSEEPAGLHGKSDLEKEPYGKEPYTVHGTEEHHVVADKLARKLSARQVQMIAIGKGIPYPCRQYISILQTQND